jgi:hypothetical protein
MPAGMLFHDRAKIEGKARITRDGYFVADALVAQADNVQAYRPDEVGQPPKADGSPYMIGRMADEVFADAAMASAAHRPITIGHPPEDVTAANWKKLAVGDIGDEISQQGKFLRVPVKMMDAAAIQAARTTHQEFSLGYTAEVDMTPTKIGDQHVDGVMRNIRINHLALVPAARGGPELRIIDERPEHLRDHQEQRPMKIKIGDAEVDLSDGAAVALAVGSLNTILADAQKQVGTLTADLATATTTIQTRDGTIVALTQQVADAAITPEKLQTLADARAKVIADAKLLAPTIVTDGKTDAEIRKMAVSAKLGDAAVKDMADATVEGAFIGLVGAGPGTTRSTEPNGNPVNLGDAAAASEEARKAMIDNITNPQTAKAA